MCQCDNGWMIESSPETWTSKPETLYRPEICLQFFIYNPVFTLHLVLSLRYHIEAELGSAEEQPNKD